MILVAPADSWLRSSTGPVCLFHLVEVDEHRSIQGDSRLVILDQTAHEICAGLTGIDRACIEHQGEHLESPGARDGSRGAVANALCEASEHEKPVRDLSTMVARIRSSISSPPGSAVVRSAPQVDPATRRTRAGSVW
jgi:hypothetical protein